MSIQPINNVSFSARERTTDKGNTYKTSVAGTIIGLTAGVALAGSLIHSQISSLKKFSGKRNLISGYHDRNIALNDIMKKEVKRDNYGKIIPPKDGVSNRTKKIVNGFKTTLAIWGTGITVLTTAIGRLVDNNITSVREKRADSGHF